MKKILCLQITKKCSRSGCSCRFYKKKRIGYKVYETLQEAKYARRNQVKAYKRGMGPKAGKVVPIITDNYVLSYGYKTQVAEQKPYLKVKDREVLESYARKLRFSHFDISANNVGYLKGKPVLIDFDMNSIRKQW